MSKKSIKFDPNPLFYQMKDFCKEMKTKEFYIEAIKGYGTLTPCIVNLGGTRSGKTWEAFHFIYWICSWMTGLKINIFRDTLDDCRQKTYEDFKECLEHMGVYDKKSLSDYSNKPKYMINGNTITFMGIPDDENIEAAASDIVYINEILETKNKKFVNGAIRRARKLSIADSNPSKTQHFIFDFEYRDNVLMTHTTWRDNKHLPAGLIADICKSAPYIDDEVEYRNHTLFYKGKPITKEHHPPVNTKNLNNKTVDELDWRVYNWGVRGGKDGLIFNKVEYTDKKPNIVSRFKNEEAFTFGLDYGFTNDSTALTRNWIDEEEKEIHVELIMYEPFNNPTDLNEALIKSGMEDYVECTADSADRYAGQKGVFYMTQELNAKGWTKIHKVRGKVDKKGGNAYWLQKMNQYTIVIIQTDQKAPEWASKKYGVTYMWEILAMEFGGYVWKKVGEDEENKPDDTCIDHAIDSVKYNFISYKKTRRFDVSWS